MAEWLWDGIFNVEMPLIKALIAKLQQCHKRNGRLHLGKNQIWLPCIPSSIEGSHLLHL